MGYQFRLIIPAIMTICVKEPQTGVKLQLTVKLPDPKRITEWLVTLPKGEVLLFKFSDGNWTTNQDEKIYAEFTKAIGRVISLLSIHEDAEKDLDEFFREPLIESGKSYYRKY